jgi:DNA-binding winged helix-turn-helix (wHTH) protein/TolB-like protein/Tfp pilus assembly protein PilF
MPTIEELNGGFDLGECEVFPLQGMMRRAQEEISLTPKNVGVLLALAKRDGNLITRDELIDEVWQGKAFSDEPIQQQISLLRGYFKDKRPYEYIDTLHGRGYRLLKPVELHQRSEVPRDEPVTKESRSLRRWKAVTAAVALGFFVIAVFSIWPPWSPDCEPPARSLAILPIDNLSGDPSNQYIVDGIRNTLAHRLSEIPDFTIKNMRMSYKGDPADIAKNLDVGHVLTGMAQLENDSLKITYEISRICDGAITGSGEVSGHLQGLFLLQERLAQAVLAELAGEETPKLITRREPDSLAYNSYMRGIYLLEHRGKNDNLETAIELFNESIQLDKKYGPAYLALATAYALLPDYRRADLEASNDLAIETVEKGIEMDRSIEDAAGSIYGFVNHKRKKWGESEAAHKRAISATVVDSNSFNWYSRMLASVGRLDDAVEVALRAEDIDPDNAVALSRIAIAYAWVGDDAKAHEYFKRSSELDSTGTTYLSAYALLLVRDQQWEKTTNLITSGVRMLGAPTYWVEPYFEGLADPARRAEALAALDLAASKGEISPQAEFAARGLIGDIDGAMEIAKLLEQPGEAFEMDLLFIPEMQALRQHEEFMPLMQRLGIVDYWKANGCKWTGDEVRCPTG